MIEKKCSKCGVAFSCSADSSGCWCENYSIDISTLQKLKENFENCLCPNCLQKYLDRKEQNIEIE